MAITVGGSNGITFPNATNTPASGVTAQFSPYITDTANVMTIQSGNSVKFDGTNGVITPLGTTTGPRASATFTYSANTANASLNVTSLSGYVAGNTDITITVNSGIYLYSTSTSNAGLTLTGGSTGDTITLVNNGYIMGMGGKGADNTGGVVSNPVAGGTALSLGFNTTVNNTNASAYIGGGGGGGGHGFNGGSTGGGGGGGAGGGAGGNEQYVSGTGGSGGSIGASGSAGATYNDPCAGAYGAGGGGGRIFPGTGGGYTSFTAQGGGSGGAGGSAGNTLGGSGGSGSSAGNDSGVSGYGSGGGGGWGASGGKGNTNSTSGAAGGKAVALNGYSVTWTSGNTTRVYGSVA